MRLTLFLFALFQLSAPSALWAKSTAVTAPVLREAAAATRLRHETTPFGWTASIVSSNRTVLELDIIDAREKRKITIRAVANSGEMAEVCEVLVGDGFWFVTPRNAKSMKSRQFEAVFPTPAIYSALAVSNLRFFDDSKFLNWEPLSVTNGVAEIGLKSGSNKEFLEGTWRAMDEFLAKDTDFLKTEKGKELQARLNALKQKQITVKVDVETGIVLESGDPALYQVKLGNFRWTEGKEFREPTQFEDYSAKWRGIGDKYSYLLHGDGDCFAAHPKHMPSRVPAEMGTSQAGCFLPKREKVLAHVRNLAQGGVHPFVIDLETGANERFGPDDMHALGSRTFGGSVSKDKKRIAVIHLPGGIDLLNGRIRVVDIASNRATDFGPVAQYQQALWLSNGKEFVVQQLMASPTNAAIYLPHVGVLRADGTFQDFGVGRTPAAVEKERILFLSRENGWVTVKKDGSDMKRLPLAMDESFQSVSMMEDRRYGMAMRRSAGGVSLHFLDLKQEKIMEMPLRGSFWSHPVCAP